MFSNSFFIRITGLSLFMIAYSCFGQGNDVHYVCSKEQMDSILKTIILDDHYIEKNKELKVVFSLKVDSLGEIHSAHIRWSINLSKDAYYDICTKIENTINAKFLYMECENQFILQKYVTCNYPFFPKKE